MDLKITVLCRVEGKAQSYDLTFQQDVVTIGRKSTNDVQIPDMQVSSEHARILCEGDAAYLVDLGSSTGTTLDGAAVGPGKKVPLGMGSQIQIAGYQLMVSSPNQRLDETTSEKTAMVAMNMVKAVLGSISGGEGTPPSFEVVNDAETGAKLELKADNREYKVGREQDCDLVLGHWSISRKHAMFRRSGNVVSVMDLGSKNGVLVNGDRVDDSRRLRDGDVVSVGHTELKFHNPGGSLLDSMDSSPTPMSNLKNLRPNLSGVEPKKPAPAPAKPTADPRPAPSDPPHRSPEPAPARPATPAAATAPDRPPRRRREPETTFADRLPMIVGILLLIGAVVAAVFLFK